MLLEGQKVTCKPPIVAAMAILAVSAVGLNADAQTAAVSAGADQTVNGKAKVSQRAEQNVATFGLA